ncbi:MAG: pantoate--beta-alanine ligase [Dehalococcoidia bacterium]|nr:pantoate--beta-alanine ligase [Dehalococcoidia bacterium]MBL7165366.1 pantoate--beta-alanine ligase [Dehalococcoidales bacterium]
MKVIETVDGIRKLRRTLAEPVGFVPTMGYLHEGHLSLVKQARKDNATVVVSIFVNPTQFGPCEDLEDYPCDIKRDLTMLEELDTDVVFMPSPDEVYPPQFNTWVEVTRLTERLEGAARPTHFRGVTTVVAKLFNIVQPTRAYFGQKDAQQAIVIQKMATDLNMNLDVIVCPTIREPDGLAMSSRNIYLTPEQRRSAVVLSQSLKLAERLWADGERNAERIRREMRQLIERQPEGQIDYISVADTLTLEELDTITSTALVSLAVRFGKTRLLDNVVLEPDQSK